MKNKIYRFFERIDNIMDRFMEALDYILPIWALIIFISIIYQMVTR